MRSLKSATTSTTITTTIGKRKLAQTKEYPDSPPTTPPNVKTKPVSKRAFDLTTSPPAKRRRSSERIAQQKSGQKRPSTGTEDDDGFVFKRAIKVQKRKTPTLSQEPKPTSSKPPIMDFTNVCVACSMACIG